jgi:N4-gp56 family major capsid protein
MATQTWTYDAPSGVYKSHTMSAQLRHAAIAQTKFLQFVMPEPGYGKKRGDTVTITRISNLAVPTQPRLVENTEIPEDVLTITTVGITVSEWGRSVPYTEFSDDLSEFNLDNIVQRALTDQMKICLDQGAAAAFKTCQLKAEGNGVASINIDTGGAPTVQATANMTVYHVEQIRDNLFGTYKVPPYEGDDYIGIVTTKVKRGLMQDPAWEPWHRYTDPEAKYNSEVGRLENIRFIESNNFNALNNSIGSSSITGEALFFGADAVAMAVAEDPELRAKIPEDYGRQKGVAWYGILEFGLIWTTSNVGEARVIHWTST